MSDVLQVDFDNFVEGGEMHSPNLQVSTYQYITSVSADLQCIGSVVHCLCSGW